MPEKATLTRARTAKGAGKAASTQAGEFVREEIHHVREGRHGARSTKQVIAIGLSKARRAGVKLPRPPASTKRSTKRRVAGVVIILALLGSWAAAQTLGEKERFTATAIVNNNLGSGAGTVLINVTRWSSDAERGRLVNTLREKGPKALLEQLRDARSVGTIRTPDSLGYDLRYAQQTRTPDGGRQIVIATDRPIGFWEARNQPRTIDYPFTVIQMNMGPEGKGRGTLSYATKIRAYDNILELEDFASSPVMLTEIVADKDRD